MKPQSTYILVAIAFLFAAQISYSNEIDDVKFILDLWPPYRIGVEGKAPTGGIAVEFTNEIFSRLNIAYSSKLYPWKLCLKYIEYGKSDGLMLLTKNAERARYMEFTDVIMTDRDLVWYEPEKFNKKFGKEFTWETFKDLQPYAIGQTAGFNYGDEFNAAVKSLNLKTDSANKDQMNFNKLRYGRIDIFICNETSAINIFKTYPKLKNKFKFAAKPFKTVKFHMAFSKKTNAKKLIPKINKIISQMKTDGTINKILGRSK